MRSSIPAHARPPKSQWRLTLKVPYSLCRTAHSGSGVKTCRSGMVLSHCASRMHACLMLLLKPGEAGKGRIPPAAWLPLSAQTRLHTVRGPHAQVLARPERGAPGVVQTWICADAKPVRVLKLSTFALNCTALNAVLSRSCCGSCAPPARRSHTLGVCPACCGALACASARPEYPDTAATQQQPGLSNNLSVIQEPATRAY